MSNNTHDGSIRGQRLPEALAADYIVPFERSYPEAVTLLRDLAQHIRFESESNVSTASIRGLHSEQCDTDSRSPMNRDPHTWADVLDKNPLIKLSRLLTYNSSRLLQEFEKAAAHDVVEATHYIERLSNDIAELLEVVSSISSPEQSSRLAEHIENIQLHMRKNTSNSPRERLLAQLRGDFESLIAGLENAKAQAKAYIDFSLTTGNVEPSVGLLLVFLKLLRKVEEAGNEFTSKHTSFYYRDMLGGVPRDAERDRTFVCFTPSPDINERHIPAGTSIETGADKNGLPVRYTTNTDVVVNSSRVSSLCTLHLERDTLVLPESDLGYVTRLYSQIERFDNKATQTVPAIPVFGAHRSTDELTTKSQGELGFAFSSSVLLSGRYDRKIAIQIQLDTEFESNAGVVSALHQLKELREKSLDPVLLKSESKDIKETENLRHLLTERVIKRFVVSEMSPGDIPSAMQIKEEVHLRCSDSDPLAILVRQTTGDVSQTYRDLLVAMVLETDNDTIFKRRLGRFLSHYLLGRTNWLTSKIRHKLLAHGCSLIHDWKVACASKDNSPTKDRVFDDQILTVLRDESSDELNEFTLHFYHLFREMFCISVTTGDGWYELPNWTIKPVRKTNAVELQLELALGRNEPAITGFDKMTHTGEFDQSAPVCKLMLNRESSFYSYSVLTGWLLKRVEIKLKTSGVTDLTVSSPTGKLDHTQQFPFFGVAPDVGSSLIMGIHEAALKKTSQVEFEATWFGLPDNSDGFASYFKGYPDEVSNDQFEVELEYLTNGEWKPVSEGSRQPLFGESEVLSENVKFSFPIEAIEGSSADLHDGKLTYTPDCQTGFFRLVLTGPEQAFGARAYSETFTRISMENMKRRLRKPLPLPQQPFVPLCERLKANYEAVDMLDLDNPGHIDSASSEKLLGFYHVHPFGTLHIPVEQSYLKRSLIPEYSYDGNLIIGISYSKPINNVELYFQLDEKLSVAEDNRIDEISWYYLASGGWKRLPENSLIQDSTYSLNRSGVVSISLPDDIIDSSSLMPKGQYWIRACASERLSNFGKIRRISTQATEVVRVDEQLPVDSANTRWVLNNDIPGVLSVDPLGVHYGERAAEDKVEFNTRMSERLRHKNRALLPWDYERLVLAQFPDVFKCKCVKRLRYDESKMKSGVVNLIAVPVDDEPDHIGVREFPRLSAVRLNEIQIWLNQYAPPSVEIAVHNPAVERIQVRCSVLFAQIQRRGELKDRLNEDISKFLWPWLPFGYSASFDWCIRINDIKTYINSLDYVDAVTDFSILQLTETMRDTFTLYDSANLKQPEISARFPVSIAAPMRNHFIQLVDNNKRLEPAAVGFDELQLNSTFVVGDKAREHA